ncbi:hypothetical protein Prudu_019020 [Prunus dulcis]|uniref:Uncharacterized protein n=1 Tax=Prunus dulcis TaxID=3755 RepID=A0A4Y1RS64_PRUDU|nr:hypothetical protein Prudu_019020 [Prunus dulcis]
MTGAIEVRGIHHRASHSFRTTNKKGKKVICARHSPGVGHAQDLTRIPKRKLGRVLSRWITIPESFRIRQIVNRSPGYSEIANPRARAPEHQLTRRRDLQEVQRARTPGKTISSFVPTSDRCRTRNKVGSDFKAGFGSGLVILSLLPKQKLTIALQLLCMRDL